ncbi:hypothetical protein BDE02_02G195200 [Populus trichocarpa]|nr:hypothetical protein BDE02_02G195200 [Populus trichocarpa]
MSHLHGGRLDDFSGGLLFQCFTLSFYPLTDTKCLSRNSLHFLLTDEVTEFAAEVTAGWS